MFGLRWQDLLISSAYESLIIANMTVNRMSNFAKPSRELHTVGLNYTKHLQTGFPNKTHFKVRVNIGYYVMKFKNYR